MEGCLSIRGIRAEVRRPEAVKATLPQLDGSVLVIETDGLLARALQHEIDHLNGVLFVDRLPAVAKVSMKNRLKRLLEENERKLKVFAVMLDISQKLSFFDPCDKRRTSDPAFLTPIRIQNEHDPRNFRKFSEQPATRQDSPFAVVAEPAAPVAASPFTAVARQESPFTVVDEGAEIARFGIRAVP